MLASVPMPEVTVLGTLALAALFYEANGVPKDPRCLAEVRAGPGHCGGGACGKLKSNSKVTYLLHSAE